MRVFTCIHSISLHNNPVRRSLISSHFMSKGPRHRKIAVTGELGGILSTLSCHLLMTIASPQASKMWSAGCSLGKVAVQGILGTKIQSPLSLPKCRPTGLPLPREACILASTKVLWARYWVECFVWIISFNLGVPIPPTHSIFKIPVLPTHVKNSVLLPFEKFRSHELWVNLSLNTNSLLWFYLLRDAYSCLLLGQL